MATFRKLPLQDKLLHLLSNTWVCVPLKTLEDQDQRHKIREQFGSLMLAGLNITVTAAIAGLVIEEQSSDSSNEKILLAKMMSQILIPNSLESSHYLTPVVLGYGLLIAASHLLGCLLLFVHYKTCHPWRHLGKGRESHCWGKLGDLGGQVRVERGVWEESQTEGENLNRVAMQEERDDLVDTDQVLFSH